jgi:hypothetical protein
MVRQELEILIERLEKALHQAQKMELEHLHFLLSMAVAEAKQELPAVRVPPLRLVLSGGRQG